MVAAPAPDFYWLGVGLFCLVVGVATTAFPDKIQARMLRRRPPPWLRGWVDFWNGTVIQQPSYLVSLRFCGIIAFLIAALALASFIVTLKGH